MDLAIPRAPERAQRERSLAHDPPKEMSDIWTELCEDALETVMLWLPIASMFDFRSVSQRWNTLFTAPYFRKRWGEVATQKQPCFFSKDEGTCVGSLYDPFVKKWHNTDYINLSTSTDFPPCSSGGLVCLINLYHTIFYIGNPLTQSWMELPCEFSIVVMKHVHGSSSVGMITMEDQDSKDLAWRSKIFLIHIGGIFEVFTIMKDSTSPPTPMTRNRIPQTINLPSIINSRALSVGSKIFITCTSPHGIITYDVVSGKWEQRFIPPPLNLADLTLVECNGRCFLMGVVKERILPAISVRVWELQITMMRMRMWREIDRMPSLLSVEFVGKRDVTFECLCNRKGVVFSLGTSRMNRLFTYDLMTREWLMIPKPIIPGKKRQTIVGGVGLFPGFSPPQI